MAKTHKVGLVEISLELLEKALDVPEGCHIIGARMEVFENHLTIKMEGPEMPETEEGQMLELVPVDIKKKFISSECEFKHVWKFLPR